MATDRTYQGCQICLGPNKPKRENVPNDHKLYQTAINYTKWSKNIPNGHKILHHFSFQGPPNFTQRGIFGLKRNHPATLVHTVLRPVAEKERSWIWPKIMLGECSPIGELRGKKESKSEAERAHGALSKQGCQIYIHTMYQNAGKIPNCDLITQWP
jgi:hypothetical protein